MLHLGLTPSELVIYALIYSYTSLGEGFFYSTFDFIATKTGISTRTVGRAVGHLTEMGLIERCKVDGRSGIRAIMSVAEGLMRGKRAACECKEATVTEERENALTEKSEDTVAEMSEAADEEAQECSPKRRLVPGRYLCADVHTGKFYRSPPENTYIYVGKHKLLKMTSRQYDKLKSLIPDWELTRYITKLESIHKEIAGRPDYWANSDYGILRKWIDKDVKL